MHLPRITGLKDPLNLLNTKAEQLTAFPGHIGRRISALLEPIYTPAPAELSVFSSYTTAPKNVTVFFPF